MLKTYQFPYGSDNYSVLLNDPATGQTVCVDVGDADAVMAALEKTGWTLTQLWITHHHGDHVAGLSKVKTATGCAVYGPAGIQGVDHILSGGDQFTFANREIDAIHTPGHTLDMLNFHISDDALLFTGDTLFVAGCGRLFEGTPAQMFDSMQKLKALPEKTTVYCAHEYTSANIAFALSVDPENADLQILAEEVREKRARDKATVPTTLSVELACNPFLRAGNVEEFAKLRKGKDNF